MSVVTIAEREPVEIEGNLLRGLAVSSTGAREAEVWEARMVAGAATPPHYHDAEEIVIVIAGSIEAEIDGEMDAVGEGELVVIPAHAVHQLRNTAAGETRKIAVLGRTGARTFWPDGTPLETPWQE
jgi:quercetin dioxygenase-like cupin family protein